jgi:hypothetical protein
MSQHPDEWGDEMPANFVEDATRHLQRAGYTVLDTHESAIVLDLTPQARAALDADDTDQVLVIGWSQAGGFDYGLSADGGYVPDPRWLGADPIDPASVAIQIDRVLRIGTPEPQRPAAASAPQ